MTVRETTLNAVRELAQAGYGDRIRLTLPRSKQRAFKGKEAMDWERLTWLLKNKDPPYGIALELGAGLLVKDKDGPNEGVFAEVRSPMIALSASAKGQHEYFRVGEEVKNRIKALGTDVDVLGNGIIIAPPSETETGRVREWKSKILSIDQLPVFPVDLLKKEPEVIHPSRPIVSQKIESLRRYVDHIFAVEGEGGDKACFRCACKIASVISDYNQALQELVCWNQLRAIPPFTEKQLRWKLTSAYKYQLRRTS